MKKGQVAAEYMVIVGFALLALIPLLIVYSSERSSMENAVNSNQALQIARQIVDSSETVYYLGTPSKTTLKVYMPSNVKSIVFQGREVIITITHQGMESEIVQQAQVNLTGGISTGSGIRYITITAMDSGVQIS